MSLGIRFYLIETYKPERPIITGSGRRRYDSRHQTSGETIMTSYQIEKQTLCRRAREQAVRELLQYAEESQKLCQAAQNEAKTASLLQSKMSAKIVTEKDEKRNTNEEIRQHLKVALLREQADVLAQEISQEIKESNRRKNEIQRICESSDELKELESKLKIAFVNKERAAQHQESLALKRIASAQERAIEENMERDRQHLILLKELAEEKKRNGLVHQKGVLINQMEERTKSLENSKNEQILKEKETIDNIIRKVNIEDNLELERRRKVRDQTRILVNDFQDEQRRARALSRQTEMLEEERIAKYNEMMHRRALEEDTRKKAVEERRKIMWVKVVEETNNQTRSRTEYEELRDMLWQEELEAKHAKEEKDRLIHRLEQKEETLRLNKAQIAEKALLITELEEQERELIKMMHDKFAADDKEEMRKNQAAQVEKERFLSKIQADCEEKRQLFELERQRFLSAKQSGVEQEQFRKLVIAEARKRLLLQHIKQLQGFLPKVRFDVRFDADY
mmetsp:Transcript_9318/g.13503  ORF Transcript_9318/g.13503 Transcript_9318/m.13503 type:complete len:509 (+) Transcript_9318:62-1588(+)